MTLNYRQLYISLALLAPVSLTTGCSVDVHVLGVGAAAGAEDAGASFEDGGVAQGAGGQQGRGDRAPAAGVSRRAARVGPPAEEPARPTAEGNLAKLGPRRATRASRSRPRPRAGRRSRTSSTRRRIRPSRPRTAPSCRRTTPKDRSPPRRRAGRRWSSRRRGSTCRSRSSTARARSSCGTRSRTRRPAAE